MNYLPSLLALGSIALLALGLSLVRQVTDDRGQRSRAALALALTACLQAAHFVEEWRTGFAAAFPAVFGFEPMPAELFIGFNLAWLAVWALAVPALRNGSRWALFAALFLALAGLLNGVAHPLLALRGGGYFPGLFTAFPVFLASLFLLQRLSVATAPARQQHLD